MRKIYPILLTMAVVLCCAPAFAEIKTINCGDPNEAGNTVIGQYDDETKVLTISGNGKMKDYTSSGSREWKDACSVIIEDGVTRIGNYAFYNCSSLTEITIPNSVSSIGNAAFRECSGLTEITIPNSVSSIGNAAFRECSGLTEVTIPNSVTSIGSSAFRECSGLTAITIPNSVTSIGDCAFYGCSGLTTVAIPNSVTSIGYSAFYNCSNLTSITIPNSVTRIGNCAFDNCRGLISVTIPNSVTSIGDNAFYGCNGLKEITIGNSVTNISSSAFSGCSGLTTVTIPNSVTSIGSSAFNGCCGLTSVTIPNSVTSIGNYAFNGCSGLTLICYEGSSEPTFKSNSFENIATTIPVCVPADYNSDSWCGFSNLYKGHEHSIANDEEIPATCTETGLTEGSHCSVCGGVFVAQTVINALGHAYDTVTFAPTCTNVGYKELTCTRCNDVIYIDTVATIAHSYSTTITAPTCTNVGYTTHTCSVCEYTYNSDTVSANGHTPDSIVFENSVAATCTMVGKYDSVVYCSVCQAEQFREEKSVTANGHNYSNTVTAPTCTKVGYTTHTCSVCSYTYNSDTVAANGHTEVVDAAVAATCTTAGKTEGKHCSVCNEVIEAQTEVAALGHNYGDYVYNNDATTDADGTETATCSRCGEKDTRPAAGTKLPEPEKDTSVSELAASAINIYAHHNIIVVENATDEIRVFDAMGKMVACGGRDDVHIVSTGTTAITIKTPGVYIVKTGETVKRVIVK